MMPHDGDNRGGVSGRSGGLTLCYGLPSERNSHLWVVEFAFPTYSQTG